MLPSSHDSVDFTGSQSYSSNMDSRALNLTRTWFDEHVLTVMQRSRNSGRIEWFAKSLSIPPIDLVEAFATYQGFGWFFRTPHGLTQLGLGLSREWQWDHIDQAERMELYLARLQAQGVPGDAVVVGGRAFSPGSPWKDWPAVYLALPTVQITRDGGGADRLTVVFPIGSDATLAECHAYLEPIWQALFDQTPNPLREMAQPLTRESIPPRHRWMENVREASHAIHEGELEKVVLARQLKLTYQRPVPVAAVLRGLTIANPDATVFAIRRQQETFLGATPEVLATVSEGTLATMCLAGSAARGMTPEEDAREADAMMRDPKIRHEHAVVRQHVLEALNPFVANVTIAPQPELKKLPTVQHLHTPVSADMGSDASIWPILATLAPTPAVSGYPVQSATHYVETHESFGRGWYAGALGWTNLSGNGTWMVPLRSGLMRDTTVALYAGCGIMGESDPEQELKESDWKMNTMLAALGVEGDTP